MSKDNAKIMVLKEDCVLFSRLCIAFKTVTKTLKTSSSSKTSHGRLYGCRHAGQLQEGTKADLVNCLSDTSSHTVKQLCGCSHSG